MNHCCRPLFYSNDPGPSGPDGSCLEEIALKKGFIDASQVRLVAETMKGNEYGRYLLRLLETEA